MPRAVSHQWVDTGGVRLHVAHAGMGPPVILLHGFPECWLSWRHQIVSLADAGFSVFAPDLRGFNLSDKPPQVRDYAMAHLMDDIGALVAATGAPSAHIVGHDWGGLVAWCFAAYRPQLTTTLTILNAPHPTVYGRRLWRSLQCVRSAYVPLFMLPWVPDRLLALGDGAIVRLMYRLGAARWNALDLEDIDALVEAALVPHALTAGLNYYRANAHLAWQATSLPRIDTPCLVLWGERDPALGTALLQGLHEVVSRLSIVRLPHVGHWAQQEAPAQVTKRLLEHLQGHSPAG